MKVSVTTVGDSSVRDAFHALRAAGADLRPAMREIAGLMEASTRLRFRDGKSPEGAPWRPLAPGTRKKRAARSRSKGTAAVAAALAGNMQPLLDTGRLRNSITSRHDATQAVIGTNVVYAPIHQFGGQAGRGRRTNVPARPFLGMSGGDREDIIEALRDHLARAFA